MRLRLIANRHESKEVFRMVRKWTNLTQEELGSQNGKKGRAWAKNIESGRSRFYFDDFLNLCELNGITITIEKEKNKYLKTHNRK